MKFSELQPGDLYITPVSGWMVIEIHLLSNNRVGISWYQMWGKNQSGLIQNGSRPDKEIRHDATVMRDGRYIKLSAEDETTI